jgi:hypothetical protein
MTSFHLRSEVFRGEKVYWQGSGKTWDDIQVAVELAPDESIVDIERGTAYGTRGLDSEIPWIRVWIQTPNRATEPES